MRRLPGTILRVLVKSNADFYSKRSCRLFVLLMFVPAFGAPIHAQPRCERQEARIGISESFDAVADYRLSLDLGRYRIFMQPESFLNALALSELFSRETIDDYAARLSSGLQLEFADIDTETALTGTVRPLLLKIVANIVETGATGIEAADGRRLRSILVQTSGGSGCVRSRAFIDIEAPEGTQTIFGVEDTLAR
jgi:hypothetical protein